MQATATPSAGDSDRADCAEAKSLLAFCHARDVIPLVIEVGGVRLELSPITRSSTNRTAAPPTEDDGNRLVRKYGGKVLEEALGEVGDQGMEPRE